MSTTSSFRLSPEEKIVASFHCSQLNFPKCDGYLTVTNNRVVFHGRGYESRVVQEVELQTISGLNSFYGSKFYFFWFMLGFMAAVAAIACFIPTVGSYRINYNSYGSAIRSYNTFYYLRCCVGVIVALFSIFCFSRCMRRAFFLQIYSSQATGSPIRIGQAPDGGLGSSAVFAITARPTEHTSNMMYNLGAMIQDLKKLGDKGIERWEEILFGKSKKPEEQRDNTAQQSQEYQEVEHQSETVFSFMKDLFTSSDDDGSDYM